MCCSPARRAWARPPWRRSWRASWASISARPRARCWRRRAILPPSSPISSRATFLFIDEIHRLNPAVEEILYPAMEDYELDLVIGEGPSARSVKIPLAPFTLVGATTRSGLITTPLRDRFGIPVRLNFYSPDELLSIVERGARVLGFDLTDDGAREIAGRAARHAAHRRTPAQAGARFRRRRRPRQRRCQDRRCRADAAGSGCTRPGCLRPPLSDA